MSRRRTHRQTCTHTGCTTHRDIEYTARRDLDTVSKTWKCDRHDKPDEILSAANPQTSVTLALHPSYIDGYRRDDPPKLVGHFWGPETGSKGVHGIVSGPGFRATASDFPPGTRLIVTARIELPDTPV